MPRLSLFSESAIRQRADAESFRRGQDYLARDAVTGIVRRGDQLTAAVEGSRYEPYRVDVTLDATGLIRAATCTCPYDYGGDCKHIVAALLACLHAPETVEDRPPLAELLDDLDRDQLLALVLDLAAQRPDLTATIEGRVNVVALRQPSAQPASQSRRTALDPNVFRRQVSAAVHSLGRMRPSEAYWHVGGVSGDVVAVAEQARPFVEGGDGRSALTILAAVIEEYVKIWFELDDSDGEASGAFYEIAPLLTEAVLAADLTRAERQEWAERLARWEGETSDYGVEDVFGAAKDAAIQGWDDPRLLHLLAGSSATTAPAARTAEAAGISPPVSDDEEDDGDDGDDDFDNDDEDEDYDDAISGSDRGLFADEIADARLRILERQGRIEEYLNLARGEGRQVAYVTMLVRAGRVAEAVTDGLARLSSPREALALAGALQEQGHGPDARRIAEHGLTLAESIGGQYYAGGLSPAGEVWSKIPQPTPRRTELARWLRESAQAAGDQPLALKAARVAVESSADLADYLATETLAGADWPDLRRTILDQLSRGSAIARVNTVDILLHEDMIDEAIAIADAASYNFRLVEQVAQAGIAVRPEWVMKAARAQAESIIEAGRSQHYDTAVRWLALMRDAATAGGREEQWRSYLDSLLDHHGRKYKLVPMLKTLG